MRGVEEKTVEAFIQRLVTGYVTHGYVFYVGGRIKEGADLEEVDRRMAKKFRCNLSEKTRVLRKRAGLSNCAYLRFAREWLLVSTHGRGNDFHPFFTEHHAGDARRSEVRDFRREPFLFHGYSISYRYEGARPKDRRGGGGGVAPRKRRGSVRIAQEEYRSLKAQFLEWATRREVEWLVAEFWRLRYYPFAPVRQQLLNLLRAVNRARKERGFEPVPVTALKLKKWNALRKVPHELMEEGRLGGHCARALALASRLAEAL